MVLTNVPVYRKVFSFVFGMLGILLTHYYALKIVKNEKLALFAMSHSFVQLFSFDLLLRGDFIDDFYFH